MKMRLAALAFALATALAAPAGASVIGFQVDRSDGLQVYRLGNGNFLGLWRLNNRERVNPGAEEVTISSADDLLDGFVRGRNRIVGFYNGERPVNPGMTEFSPLVFGFTIADNALLRRSVWVEWTGGVIRYRQPNGHHARMTSNRVTRAGDPLAVVPVPAALPLLLAGVGALGLMARRRRAA